MINIFGMILTNWYAGCSLVGLVMLNGATELGERKRRSELAQTALAMGDECAHAAQAGMMQVITTLVLEQQQARDSALAAMEAVGKVN